VTYVNAAAKSGMTNYRIDGIGTHRHRISPNRHGKQGQGYEGTVSRYEYWVNGKLTVG